jgi:hypothetical protein
LKKQARCSGRDRWSKRRVACDGSYVIEELETRNILYTLALDPLTGAALTLKEIREMASEMLEIQKQWLPQFVGKTIRPTPTISIPKDVQRADVPIDPALAIFAKFGEPGAMIDFSTERGKTGELVLIAHRFDALLLYHACDGGTRFCHSLQRLR